MTDRYEFVGAIRRDLRAIADFYDEALEPARRANGSQVKVTKEPPLPIGAHVLDVRAEAHRDLMYWSRFLLDEVRDVNGDPMQHGPTDVEPATLTAFVSTWVDWVASNMPDDADNLANDAEKHARALRQLARPERRDWMPIGECPVTVSVDGSSVPCGAQVRAYAERQFIACPSCGTEDTLAWWMSQIVGNPDAKPLVTAGELISIVARDVGHILTEPQIRQWASRNQIPRAGRDLKGRVLYDHRVVIMLIKDGRAA